MDTDHQIYLQTQETRHEENTIIYHHPGYRAQLCIHRSVCMGGIAASPASRHDTRSRHRYRCFYDRAGHS